MSGFRDEPIAATVIEHLAPRLLGRDIGKPIPRDARDRSGLRIDLTYDETTPQIALEVTGLHVPSERALGGEIDRRLEPALTEIVTDEGLGGWVLTLDAHARVNDLIREVPDLLRRGESFRSGDYSSDDLFALDPPGRTKFLDQHRHFKQLGLVEIERVSSEHGVRCIAFGAGGEISGFTDRLAEEVGKNTAKLQEARPRETHLAVIAYDFQASRLPDKTPPPEFPRELDRLWVIHSWPQSPGLIEVWTASRGASSWIQSQLPREVLDEGVDPTEEGEGRPYG